MCGRELHGQLSILCPQVKKMAEHDNFVNSCCPLRRGPPLLVSGSDDGTAKVRSPMSVGNREGVTPDAGFRLLEVLGRSQQPLTVGGVLSVLQQQACAQRSAQAGTGEQQPQRRNWVHTAG